MTTQAQIAIYLKAARAALSQPKVYPADKAMARRYIAIARHEIIKRQFAA